MPSRPAETEYASFYNGYIALVTEENILDALSSQISEMRQLFASASPAQETHRYAPGKWSVREMLGHIGDAERVFGYRALTFSRGAQTPLPGFDENEFVATANFDQRSLASLLQEFMYLREANLAMLRPLDDTAWKRTGTANNAVISVRALAYIMVGHARHHLTILRERYGIGK